MTRTAPATPPGTRGPARFRAAEETEQTRSVGTAIAAGAALLLLVVGVPAALLAFTGAPPFPTGLPSREDLTQPLSTDTLLVVLRLVVWLAWLQFAVSVVVEAASLVRGRGLPRHVPFAGLSQQLARTLVSALLVGGVVAAGGTSASAAPVAESPETVAVQVEQSDESAASTAEASPEVAGQEGPRALHVGVPSTMTDVIGKKVYVVQPPKGHYHDNLWDIAERHLGDGRRWKEIFSLNDGREQPDGRQLVIGRLIQPGWVMVMPDDATGLTRVQQAPETPAAPAPPAEPGASEAGTDTAGGEQPGGGVGEQGSAEATSLSSGLLLGGLFSAGLLGALTAERRRRRGSDPDGEAAETEVALRVGADHDRARWLDAALRGLGTTCRASRTALPPVYAAVVDDERIDLRLAPARPEAPAPWTAVDDGRTWRLHRSDADATEPGHAPFPGLVCLGRDAEGRDVLVDLESVGGVVSVSGADRLAGEVVAALAVQLVANPWADEQHVLGYHLAPVLADIAGDRLRTVEDLGAVLEEAERSRPTRASDDVLTGRLARRPGLVPEYLVCGAVPEPELLERLGELTGSGERGFGVVSVGSMSGVALHVDESGTLHVPLLDLSVEAVRLTERSARDLGELFVASRAEQVVEDRGRVPVAASGRPGDDAHWSAAEVRVGVLGPVETRTGGSVDPTRLALATEIVAFLALQSGPVHPSVLAASIWPRGVTPEVRDATIERVREWLGADVDASHHLRQGDDGRVWLSDDVAVDWSAFCELVGRSRRAGGEREEAELLRRALQLVRGELLEDRPAGRYAWLARTNLERHVPDLVVDAAHRLAELYWRQGDPGGAAAAARAGLRGAPGAQLLWRDLLRSEYDAGGPAAAEDVVAQMSERLAARGGHVEAETEALVEELLPSGLELPGGGVS